MSRYSASGPLAIRRQIVLADTTRFEYGVDGEPPLVRVAVVAIIGNPFAGKSYAGDLGYFIERSAALGTQMAQAAIAAMGSHGVESYGKAAVAGMDGEQEHAIALITTPFGDALRAGIGGGEAWISSVSKRSAPGAAIDVPLAHKDALYVRSHYDAMTVHLPDAPLADEVAILACFANRGRLNARLGGLDAGDVIGKDGLR
jgi:hypothetical protein